MQLECLDITSRYAKGNIKHKPYGNVQPHTPKHAKLINEAKGRESMHKVKMTLYHVV